MRPALPALAILAGALAVPAAVAQVVAFDSVNVIPMDRKRVLERHTVVVRDGRIVQAGPSTKVKPPAGAVVVDGKGKFLMPGFAEMHGHLPNPDTPADVVESVLLLYVANGVTTVRGMLGHPSHLELKKRVAEGQLLGPTLYLAGPSFGGPALTPEQAASRVKEQKSAGYDLLKVQEGLRMDTYDAMASSAKSVKIAFGGHVPNDVGLLHCLKSGQVTIDHLDGYLDALEADNSPIKNADPKIRAQQLPLHIDESKISELVAATRKAGASVVPTMALWETFNSAESAESYTPREELKYVPRQWVDQWVKQKSGMLQNLNPSAGARVLAVRKKILKALSDGGVSIIFGTDSPQVFSVPGFSIYREIPILIDAGLSPYQVLASGTSNVARYLGSKNSGTVEAGKAADLILLEANPLENIAHLSKRAGVMVRGKWLPESELQAKLHELARKNSR